MSTLFIIPKVLTFIWQKVTFKQYFFKHWLNGVNINDAYFNCHSIYNGNEIHYSVTFQQTNNSWLKKIELVFLNYYTFTLSFYKGFDYKLLSNLFVAIQTYSTIITIWRIHFIVVFTCRLTILCNSRKSYFAINWVQCFAKIIGCDDKILILFHQLTNYYKIYQKIAFDWEELCLFVY